MSESSPAGQDLVLTLALIGVLSAGQELVEHMKNLVQMLRLLFPKVHSLILRMLAT